MSAAGAAEPSLELKGWLLAALICLPALIPVLRPGWFEGHDDLHIFRMIEYDLALRDGQIPPRWFPDVSAGYGNPHPIYYAPLFYMVAELFQLAGCDVILALKGAIVLFTLAASVSMYAFARIALPSPAALVAAAAYTYVPYHLLDLYVRKAFSEFSVFACLPALLLALHRIRSRGSRADLLSGALATAATALSHTITNMLVPPLVAAYAAILAMPAPGRPPAWRWLGRAAVSMLLGYALAGFFLVPAFLERNDINLKIFTEAYVDYHKHFVFPRQLVWWPWGFGMSLEGTRDQMSFRMGLPHLAGAALAWLGLGRLRRPDREASRLAGFFLGVTGVAIFLMLPPSALFWDLLPPFKFIQFPWRFLMLTCLSTGFLCGAAFAAFGPRARAVASGERQAMRVALMTAGALAAGAVLGGMLQVNLRVPASRVGFESKPFNTLIDRGPGAPAVSLDGDFVRRHTLHWLDHLPPGTSFMGLDATDLKRPRVESDPPGAVITLVEERTWKSRFIVQTDAATRIRVNRYRFPGWVARVDGAPSPLIEAAGQRKVILLEVGPGRHEVTVAFESTPARRLGDAMTLTGLAGLALLGLWPAPRPGPAPPPG